MEKRGSNCFMSMSSGKKGGVRGTKEPAQRGGSGTYLGRKRNHIRTGPGRGLKRNIEKETFKRGEMGKVNQWQIIEFNGKRRGEGGKGGGGGGDTL